MAEQITVEAWIRDLKRVYNLLVNRDYSALVSEIDYIGKKIKELEAWAEVPDGPESRRLRKELTESRIRDRRRNYLQKHVVDPLGNYDRELLRDMLASDGEKLFFPVFNGCRRHPK
jgi:hypothetical protein